MRLSKKWPDEQWAHILETIWNEYYPYCTTKKWRKAYDMNSHHTCASKT